MYAEETVTTYFDVRTEPRIANDRSRKGLLFKKNGEHNMMHIKKGLGRGWVRFKTSKIDT